MNTLYHTKPSIYNIIKKWCFWLVARTGCSLNIVFFFKDFEIFWTFAFLCFPSSSLCVHTPDR